MKPTFIEVSAAFIIAIVLAALITIFCLDTSQRGAVTTAFISLLSAVSGFLFHAAITNGQQKQMQDTNDKLVDALQQSQPQQNDTQSQTTN